MPYQKGQSGNLRGRPPKGLALSDIITVRLAQQKAGKSRLDRIIDKAIKQAESGDKDARSWLSERGWGKAPQPVVGEEGKGPVSVRIIYEQPALS